MPMKTPSTSWVVRSRMKWRRMRGEYWLDARESATTVIENPTPATVIMEVATALSISREPSALAPRSRGHSSASSSLPLP